MCCDKIITARINVIYVNHVFLQYLTLSVHLDLVIYPTQATKQVRLLFRSHRILTCNGYFKGGKFENFDTFQKHEINRRIPRSQKKGCILQFTFCFRQFALFVYFNVLRSLLILRDFRDRGSGQILLVLFNLVFRFFMNM